MLEREGIRRQTGRNSCDDGLLRIGVRCLVLNGYSAPGNRDVYFGPEPQKNSKARFWDVKDVKSRFFHMQAYPIHSCYAWL